MQEQILPSRNSENGEFDLSKIAMKDSPDKIAVTFWIPAQHKKKYDLLQDRSRRAFSRFLTEILINQIERVKVDEAG